jgi:hypothetical protein
LLGWLDFQRFAGARIAAGARSALANVESAEADQADGVAFFQSFLDGSTVASRARPAAALEISAEAAIGSISSVLFIRVP